MVNYQCIRCGYETKDKSKIKSHLSRKTICKPYLNDVNLDDYKEMILNCKKIVLDKKNKECQKNVNTLSTKSPNCQKNVNTLSTNSNIVNSEEDNKYECEFCEKIFTTRQGKWRHLKSCKEKKKDDDQKSNLLHLVEMLNQQLYFLS